MADRPELSEEDTAKFVSFLEEAVAIARELKGRDDLLA